MIPSIDMINYFSVSNINDLLLTLKQKRHSLQKPIFSTNELELAVKRARELNTGRQLLRIYLILRYEVPEKFFNQGPSEESDGEEPDIGMVAQIGYDAKVLSSDAMIKQVKEPIIQHGFPNIKFSRYEELNLDLKGKIDKMVKLSEKYSEILGLATTTYDATACYQLAVSLYKELTSSLMQIHERAGLTSLEWHLLEHFNKRLEMSQEELFKEIKQYVN